MAKQKLDEKYEASNIITRILNIRQMDTTRIQLEAMWFKYILYYDGDQWIQWFTKDNRWMRLLPNENKPLPVSNYIRPAVKDEKALFLNKSYIPRVWPNSNSPEDIKAAKIGEALITDMDAANDFAFDEEKDKFAFWTILFGTSFMRTFPDLTMGEYGIDANGQIIPSGEVVSEAVMPFNMILDPIGDTLRKKRYVGMLSYKDKEWVEDTFGIKINSASDKDRLRYIYTLNKYVSDVTSGRTGSLVKVGHNEAEIENLVEFKEVEFRPTPRYPLGRYIVFANDDKIYDIDRLPTPTKLEKNEWMYTFTDSHFDKIPGSFWGKSFMADLISPQDGINQIDQAYAINRKSLGRTRVVAPEGTKITKKSKFGDNILVLTYDPMRTGGTPPKFDNGIPLPAEVASERERLKEVIQSTSGNPNHVLGGEVPTSDASGKLIDILQESAESTHAPIIKAFYRDVSRVYRKRLIFAQKTYTEQRIIKVVGPWENISIKKFKAADLRNNTDVRLEPTTSTFKTKASEAQSLLMLIQSGQFANDPYTKREVLRKMGLSNLIGDAPNVHASRADEENIKMADGETKGIFMTDFDNNGRPLTLPQTEVMYDDPLFNIDNHAIHYDCHTRFALSEEFTALSKKVQNFILGHAEMHKVAMDNSIAEMQAKQMAQIQMMGQTQPPPVQPAPESPETIGV